MEFGRQKRLLVLGGTYFQVPAIEYAKSQGYYVITCDYLPSNPGHRLADEYHNVSTTDKEAVLALARELEIDGVLCFASDPAAPTAAFVAEKMNLAGNTFDNICRFGEKHLWREFLAENGFSTPRAKSYISIEEVDCAEWRYPVMVKPIDSSGSKGVTKVCKAEEMAEAFAYAQTFSRAGRIIVEEFVERVGAQIGGDGFFGKEKLDFVCFGDQVVDNSINGFVPCGMMFPSKISDRLARRIHNEIERAISISGLRDLSFNLEVMVDKEENIYLMEIGPRNGGNCIPEVIEEYSGVNMVGLAVEAAMGNSVAIVPHYNDTFHAYYALHSDCAGRYRGYEVAPTFEGEVTKQYIFLEECAEIGKFTGSNQTIGILLLRFATRKQMESFFAEPNRYIKVVVE
ncbi:MAG: ATP-grasp domain-containing protein [Alistipes sp.]|nr:ATP-grasp domain-containing protein [Alistipes sp.]